MKKIKYAIEYAFVRGLDFVLSLPPRRIAFAWGEKIGLLFSIILAKRNVLIKDNLRHAFPDKMEAELDRITTGVWRNIGRTAVEFLRLPSLSAKNLNDLIIWDGAENIEKAYAAGHGVVLLTAHFTNWEMTGMGLQARFGHLLAVARPMKNPLVEDWVRGKRLSGGMKITLHREAVRACFRWVRNKGMVGILVDQNLYTGGVFVDFFGRPAATTTLPALLHIRTGAPVILTYTLREGNKFRLVCEPPIVFPQVPEDQQALAYTQTINDHVEKMVRKRPENWFWIHNRWKRKPIQNEV